MINDNYFCKDSPFQRSNDTRVIYERLFQSQNQHMTKNIDSLM